MQCLQLYPLYVGLLAVFFVLKNKFAILKVGQSMKMVESTLNCLKRPTPDLLTNLPHDLPLFCIVMILLFGVLLYVCPGIVSSMSISCSCIERPGISHHECECMTSKRDLHTVCPGILQFCE